jgi:hypothetical protein
MKVMDQSRNEALDRLTKVIGRAAGISDDEAERISSTPFSYARLRAGIEAERRRREQGTGWFAPLLVASRAITVLAVVTIAALSTLWFSKTSVSGSVPSLSANAEDVSRVVTGGTCALSTTEECAISTEEVLATLFADNEGEEPK